MHTLQAGRFHHPTLRPIVLLLGAGTLIACFSLSGSSERPPIPEEELSGLTLLTPGKNASFQNPTWSPDGRHLAYDLANPAIGASRDAFPADAEVYVMNLDTGTRRQLTDNEVADVQPDWSPNGGQITFARTVEGSGYPPRVQLMLIGADGHTEQVLFECPTTCLDPRWSPDGELIAFGMDGRIWTVHRDGSNPREVSRERVGAAEIPSWSPDGDSLVYWAIPEAEPVSQITEAVFVVVDLSTGEETIVLSGVSLGAPDWFPLSSSILYSDQPAPQKRWTLFTLDLETGEARRLIPLDLEYNLFDAVWSPDGRRIAFAYGFETTTSHLYILDLAELGSQTP